MCLTTSTVPASQAIAPLTPVSLPKKVLLELKTPHTHNSFLVPIIVAEGKKEQLASCQAHDSHSKLTCFNGKGGMSS